MKFHDAQRPRQANGNPCWQQAHSVALPGLYVEPSGEDSSLQFGMVSVGVVIEGSWNYIEILILQLADLLRDWAYDPEDALKRWFGVDAPQGRRSASWVEPPSGTGIAAKVNVEDLDL